MNSTIENILKRRSCRSFTEEKISENDVKTILECAIAAPSGMNLQTWSFVAVTDREKIQKLAKAVEKALGRTGYTMYNPDVLIITTNEKTSRFCEVDNACAMENIYIAATALNIGCVWINQLKDCFDNPEVRKILADFGIPDSHGVYGCAALGYSKTSPAEKEIKASYRIVS